MSTTYELPVRRAHSWPVAAARAPAQNAASATTARGTFLVTLAGDDESTRRSNRDGQ